MDEDHNERAKKEPSPHENNWQYSIHGEIEAKVNFVSWSSVFAETITDEPHDVANTKTGNPRSNKSYPPR